MKIFTRNQIQELDQYTIMHESISSIDLMERAANAVSESIIDKWGTDTAIVVFAGPGNNGGDALAVARILALKGYGVTAYLFNVEGHLSEDCEKNAQRAESCGKLKQFTVVKRDFKLPSLTDKTLVIDGLFGTGLDRPLSGGFASLVKYINQSVAKVVSIDIPSGLMSEYNGNNNRTYIIKADLTLTFQQKKLSFLMADNQIHLGEVEVLDIGLSKEFINKEESSYNILERDEVRSILRPRSDFANKGTMGHALLIAGSHGMAGASILAARGCLRSGAGKVTVHIPQNNCAIMHISVPEAIVHADVDEYHYSDAFNTDMYDAVGIGPGLGQSEETAIALIAQLRRTSAPLVLDADALNILANHRTWLQQLPKGIIMTPHTGELDRLYGSRCSDDSERLARAQELAKQFQAYIILKGHYSALCLPDGKVIFNSTGNSGMATAGSGDVLTGIITSLLARGYEHHEACLLGMYLHGLAGDITAEKKGKESLIASDIIEALPQAFLSLS